MNWLAHLYLSEPSAAFRIGNLLPDIVPFASLASLPREFQRGAAQHLRIDAFTDAHPVFRQSVRRFAPPLRRFAGILVDVFFDHFLAREWQAFAKVPLPNFAAEVYASIETHRADIPTDAYMPLARMRDGDWLCSYREVDGVADTLRRISLRLRKPMNLEAGATVLAEQYEEFRSDFAAFFPALQSHVVTPPFRPAAHQSPAR